MALSEILGIDVSKAKLDVVRRAPQHQAEYRVFDNSSQGITEFLEWLADAPPKEFHACLEATGHYGAQVAQLLHTAGVRVSIVNPAQIKAFARSQLSRNKTDKQDAFVIAEFCAAQEPLPWQPPDAQHAEFQALVRHMVIQRKLRERERSRLRTGHLLQQIAERVRALDDFLSQQVEETEQLIEGMLAGAEELRLPRPIPPAPPPLHSRRAPRQPAALPVESGGRYLHHNGMGEVIDSRSSDSGLQPAAAQRTPRRQALYKSM